MYKSEKERLQRAVTYKVNCIDNIIQRYIHIYIYILQQASGKLRTSTGSSTTPIAINSLLFHIDHAITIKDFQKPRILKKKKIFLLPSKLGPGFGRVTAIRALVTSRGRRSFVDQAHVRPKLGRCAKHGRASRKPALVLLPGVSQHVLSQRVPAEKRKSENKRERENRGIFRMPETERQHCNDNDFARGREGRAPLPSAR